MNLKTTRVDLWSTEIDDQPGSLAKALRAIADYGGDLDFVVARRLAEKPGRGVVLVSPLVGTEQRERAEAAGMQRANDLPTLRIEGTHGIGTGAKLAEAIADAGVNLHEVSTATYGNHFVTYALFDNAADLEKAETAIKALAASHWHLFRHHTTRAA